MPRAYSLSDFEDIARRTLPRALFGYVSGGVETDQALRGNLESFDRWAFLPRVLTDVAQRDTSTEIFGQRYAVPFGVAPMGGLGLGWPQGDLALAQAAGEMKLPFLLSGASTTPLERIRQACSTSWFQAYLPTNEKTAAGLVERVARAGYEILVITVDVPVVGNRENNLKLGFSLPLRPSLQLAMDGIEHPRWLLGTLLRMLLTSGMPHFENYSAARGGSVFSAPPSMPVGAGSNRPQYSLTWSSIEAVRRLWRGKLVIKGILNPDDARRAATIGADGIIVSNHGGRQLDGALAPLAALPEIVAAVPNLVVMMDGGVRRGTHILKALALGARFVFMGRPMYYAVASGGTRSARRAMTLMADEVDNDMALMGITRLDQLDRSAIVRL